MHVTIEGTQHGTLTIAPGERQLLRVLNASAGRVFDLSLDGEQLGLVAMDGYPICEYPGSHDIAWVSHIVIPPAGRAEFVVIGPEKTAILRSACYNSGSAGDRDPEVVLARLEPKGKTNSRIGSIASADYNEGEPIGVGAAATSRTVKFTEDGDGYYINNQAFDMKSMKPMFITHSGTLEEWTIENDTDEVHAFHIHQVHFAVLKVNGVKPSLRYWQDTALVPPQRRAGRKSIPGRITVLIDFRSPLIKGDFPFHCHMLDHEDGGMMAIIRVV
jgi:suppressor of ftsI